MEVYVRKDGQWQYVHGPADLSGVRGDVLVRGKASEADACKWCIAIGIAVAFGANVRREEEA
jgi:hypothetical protein